MRTRFFYVPALISLLLIGPRASGTPIPCVPTANIASLPGTTCTIGNITYTFTSASSIFQTQKTPTSGVLFGTPPTVTFTPVNNPGSPGFILGGPLVANPRALGVFNVTLEGVLDYTFKVDTSSGPPMTSIGALLTGFSVSSAGANSEALVFSLNETFNLLQPNGSPGSCGDALAQVDSSNGIVDINENPDVFTCFTPIGSGSGAANFEATASGFATATDPGEFVANPPPNFGAPTPEPATVWLLLSGLLGVGAAVRRSKSHDVSG